MTDETREADETLTVTNSDENSEHSETSENSVPDSNEEEQPSDVADVAVTSPTPATTRETREVLSNPFKAGEQITIPAGTTYTTANPAIKGRHKTKRAQTVTVDETFPAFLVRTKSNRVLVRPLRIRTKGSGGYAKDINITEMIVRLNGKTPQYEPIPVDV